jgi:hypothetical protein
VLGVNVDGDRCPVGIDPALQFCARDARDGHLKYFGQSVRAVSTQDRVERQVTKDRAEASLPVRMHVRLRMHDPSLRSASADHAAKEHRPAIARHGVVVPRHVAVNPAPHNVTFSRKTDGPP